MFIKHLIYNKYTRPIFPFIFLNTLKITIANLLIQKVDQDFIEFLRVGKHKSVRSPRNNL